MQNSLRTDHLLRVLLISLAVFLSVQAHTQVAINESGVDASQCAMLDINSSDKGLLIPRVALQNINNQSPITGIMVEGLLVYNTTTHGELEPGFYWWGYGKWNTLASEDSGGSGTNPNSILVSESFDPGLRLHYWDAFVVCAESTEGGHTDWYLPNITEAELLDRQDKFGDADKYLWTTSAGDEGIGNSRKNFLYKPSEDDRKLIEISGKKFFRCVR